MIKRIFNLPLIFAAVAVSTFGYYAGSLFQQSQILAIRLNETKSNSSQASAVQVANSSGNLSSTTSKPAAPKPLPSAPIQKSPVITNKPAVKKPVPVAPTQKKPAAPVPVQTSPTQVVPMPAAPAPIPTTPPAPTPTTKTS